jgi:prepilin-type N-terminal cleavage/methylation domain-containing protein
MQTRGYSLVEMVVVIGIISILLAIGTLKFNEYMKRYRTEAQTRMVYAELLNARANALYQRRSVRVKLYAGHFDVYSSTQDDTNGVAPVHTQTLSYPIVCSATNGDGLKGGYLLDFDSKGLTSNWCTICMDNSDGTGAVDSVKIFETRVSIGKKDKGDGNCKPENITIR